MDIVNVIDWFQAGLMTRAEARCGLLRRLYMGSDQKFIPTLVVAGVLDRQEARWLLFLDCPPDTWKPWENECKDESQSPTQSSGSPVTGPTTAAADRSPTNPDRPPACPTCLKS